MVAARPAFFFDTFALVELARDAAAYAPYKAAPIFTHQGNVYEYIAARLRAVTEPKVRDEVRRMAPNLLEAATDDLFAAAAFRQDHADRRVSYVDALGWVLARKNGMRFLTGDRAFKGIENVEFVP